MNATAGATSPTSPPPPPPPPPARPPLRRRREDRVLGGVAGGLADHLGLDVALVRIVLVVLALLNGLGVLAYIVGWIAIPEADPDDPASQPAPAARAGGRDPLFWVGVGLLVLGAIALVTGPLALLPAGSAPELVIPLLLIGFGLALWRAGDPDSRGPASGQGAATPSDGGASRVATSPGGAPPAEASTGPGSPPPADPWAAPAGAATDPTARMAASPPPAPPTQPPRRSEAASSPDPDGDATRRRSWVTRGTLGLVLVVTGVLWVLRLAGVAAVGGGTILSVALLLVGVGLLVGSVVGGGRWLILAGALLLPLVLVAQVASPGTAAVSAVWDGAREGQAVGEFRLVPATLDELEDEYRLGAGSFRLDLTDLDLDGQEVAVDVELGAGDVRVVVPDDVTVTATGSSGIGQVRLFDARATAGFGAGPLSAAQDPRDPAGSIELDLSVGVGEVRVTAERASR